MKSREWCDYCACWARPGHWARCRAWRQRREYARRLDVVVRLLFALVFAVLLVLGAT